eukprot:1320950-Prymnesium_polylepis.1
MAVAASKSKASSSVEPPELARVCLVMGAWAVSRMAEPRRFEASPTSIVLSTSCSSRAACSWAARAPEPLASSSLVMLVFIVRSSGLRDFDETLTSADASLIGSTAGSGLVLGSAAGCESAIRPFALERILLIESSVALGPNRDDKLFEERPLDSRLVEAPIDSDSRFILELRIVTELGSLLDDGASVPPDSIRNVGRRDMSFLSTSRPIFCTLPMAVSTSRPMFCTLPMA